MADISKQIEQLLKARFGRDVRQSFIDALDAVNSSAEGSAAAAEKAMEEAVISASIAAYQVECLLQEGR